MEEISHTSPSSLGLFKKCQQQWFFRYVVGLKIPPNMVMMQGTAFDRAESHNFQQKIKTQEDVKLSVVQDVLHDAFQEEVRVREAVMFNEGIQPVEEEGAEATPTDAENKALEALKVFHVEHAHKVMPKTVQRQFSVPLLGLGKPYALQGIMDLEALEIVDFDASKAVGIKGAGWIGNKTAIFDLKLTGKSYPQNEAVISEQLTAYDAATVAETGQHAPQLALLATVKLKTPRVQFLPTTRTDEDTERFLRGLGNVVRQVELVKEGKMDPTPAAPGAWWCNSKWCGYWKFCKIRPKE